LESGTIRAVDIEETMRTAYLDYAMSVIVSRALPDARDGLKPVHRRILYAMHDMGLRHNASYRKSARIVGEVLGKYHPHGDTAVYDAMARMARISEEMLIDIAKDTVEFIPNFDDSLHEPTVLPARLPNLLLNGSSGIAVGMATNIAPHNLNELCDALVYLIDRYAEIDDVTVEDLMVFVHGPDFPTGGLIVGSEGIVNAYRTGRGRITMRAVTHVEDMRGGRQRIVVTELPYQVNKSNLMERIATLVRDERISDITDLRDESDRRGMSIVIELKRGVEPQRVLNQLFKYTQLQSTFGYNCLALVDGAPRTLSLKQALRIYIEHRREVIVRRSQFDLERAQQRAHVLEGLRVALDHIQAVIETILGSPNADTARARLTERFGLTEAQAQAILDLQLRRLARLERERIEDEYAGVIQSIAYLEDLLANPRKILYLIRQDVLDLKRDYGDARRTHIAREVDGSIEVQDLIPDVRVLISITRQGYVKRTPAQAYAVDERQRARMVGIQGVATHDEDAVVQLLAAGSRNGALFFTNRGKVYQEMVYQIPEGERTARGIPIRNLIRLGTDERVTAAVAVPDFGAGAYVLMVTTQGRAKRVALSEFAQVRANGRLAFNLDKGDELGLVLFTDGTRDVILTTALGRALRFAEDQVNTQGRTASGVLGIRLAEGDRVAYVDVVEQGGELLVLTANGFGKRTPLDEYPVKGRNTGGVITLHPKYLDQTGPIVAALVVQPEDTATLITANGMALPIEVAEIPQSARSTRGQIVMNIYKGDRLSAVARLRADASSS